RTTFSTGMVIIDSARKAITELCRRAAGIWGVSEDAVTFEDGHCKPASANVGSFEPLSIAQIAAKTMASHGAIAGHSEMNVTGAGPGFGLHVGEVPVVPTMAAIANAIGQCIGVRPQSLPMSPPKILKLIDEHKAKNGG